MKTSPPNNRLYSIDLARGLAVLFMIAVHTLEVFASPEVRSSGFGQIVEFLGGPPAAPVFMTLMGLSFIYSRQSGLKPKLMRGLSIFGAGYLLNILRGVIPFSLANALQLDIATTFPTNGLNAYTLFSLVDILQFAGLALMIMALLQACNVSKYLILLLAFLISMVSPWLWGLHTNLPLIKQLFELLWGDQAIGFSFIENKIAFPLFPWLSFPLLGMFLGYTLKSGRPIDQTFKHWGIAGALTLSLGLGVSASNMEYHFNDYYHSRQGAMLFMAGFVMLWMYLCQLAIRRLPANSAFQLLFMWSKGVTPIYFAQWILIIWSIALFGINQCSYSGTLWLMLAFTVLAHFCNEGYIRLQSKNKAQASD